MRCAIKNAVFSGPGRAQTIRGSTALISGSEIGDGEKALVLIKNPETNSKANFCIKVGVVWPAVLRCQGESVSHL